MSGPGERADAGASAVSPPGCVGAAEAAQLAVSRSAAPAPRAGLPTARSRWLTLPLFAAPVPRHSPPCGCSPPSSGLVPRRGGAVPPQPFAHLFEPAASVPPPFPLIGAESLISDEALLICANAGQAAGLRLQLLPGRARPWRGQDVPESAPRQARTSASSSTASSAGSTVRRSTRRASLSMRAITGGSPARRRRSISAACGETASR